jgi:hypothetical protein
MKTSLADGPMENQDAPGTGDHHLAILELPYDLLQDGKATEMSRLVGELRVKDPIKVQKQDHDL